MKIVLLISLAGVVGTLLRYFAVKAVNALLPAFPWGTLAVNIFGAFIAGFCYVVCKNKFAGFEEYFPVLFMGFLGAFTTFSSFAVESVVFFDQAQYAKFFLNILLQNLSGISAAAGGFYLAKYLLENLK